MAAAILRIWAGRETIGWRAVDARIVVRQLPEQVVGASSDSAADSAGPALAMRVRYEYAVGARRYAGSGVVRGSRAELAERLDDFRPGAAVTAYYAPSQPWRSALGRGVDARHWGALGAGLLLLVLSVVRPLPRRRRAASALPLMLLWLSLAPAVTACRGPLPFWTPPPPPARPDSTAATGPSAAATAPTAGGGVAQQMRPAAESVMTDSVEIDGEMVRVVCPADSADRARAIAGGPRPRFPSQVDRPAAELAPPRGTPAPPSTASGTGATTLRFVVGADGVPEPQTITLIRTADAQGAARACGAVLRSRYEPARLGGRAVRQWVERTYAF